MVIFTDGLTEIKSDSGEMVNNETVCDLWLEIADLSLAETLEQQTDDVERRHDTDSRDDTTLVGIKALY